MLSPTRSKKLIDSFYGGVKESLSNPLLLRLQGYAAMRNGPLEIIAELGGVQRNVIIDTGAEINVIARDFVWQNGWENMVKEQKNEILDIHSLAKSICRICRSISKTYEKSFFFENLCCLLPLCKL